MSGGIKHGPRARKSHQTEGFQSPININQAQVSFDNEAFNHLIRSHGVRMVHHRAVPDPTGMASRGDIHAVQAPRQSSDGFLYKQAGNATAFFATNTNNPTAQVEGALAHATAYITLPEVYEDGKPILVTAWDRFYLADIEIRVATSQYVESNSTGIDRLNFPATAVEHLIDANGREYHETQDYVITEEGHIKWISQDRPGWNPTLNRGTVYAIRYRYTPYFIVNRVLHEIRVAQITDMATGERKLERMPYQIQVIREHVFLDKNREKLTAQDDPRFQDAPPSSGMMGPQ